MSLIEYRPDKLTNIETSSYNCFKHCGPLGRINSKTKNLPYPPEIPFYISDRYISISNKL